ncbi:MAG: cytidine deaminase [Prevotella sp.]|nr:cytidine deaminase [Prevotella sp.]MBQ2523991.1 cytidine deaminase [Prevotella sp.]MBQ4028725.1 cytidine deaminase [Prevotella sp.]MBQ4210566.1 cytidine deaminase [Prevotella sp.]
MDNLKIEIDIQYCSTDELSVEDRELVEKAIKATDNSYSKYSHFCVGAAVRLADGAIVIGANQENAAFPSGLCAERSAIFAAQSQFPELAITTLAIAAKNHNGLVPHAVSPCGACRQVILEIEDRYKQPIRILLYGTEGTYVIKSIKDLMPLSFAETDMYQ